MTRRLVLLALLACGQPSMTPVATPCEEAAFGQALEIPLGGRVVLAPPEGSRVTDLEVTSSGGLVATRLDVKRWELKAPYEATSAEVKTHFHCGDTAGANALQASTRAPKWSALSQWSDPTAGMPGNREYGNMWLDGADRILVHGGFHYLPKQFTASSDLWSFDLKTRAWTELATTGVAAPQFMGGRMVPLPGSRSMLFFGGVDASFQPAPHLEKLDPVALTWTTVQAQGTPAYGDYQPGAVWDSKRGRFLSVCGQSATPHCKVTSLTVPSDGPAKWEAVEVASGPAPAGRAGHFFAYDAATDRVIIFAGMANGILGDTWSLELGETPARWVQLADETDELKRRNGAWALDEKNHRFIVWGGTPDGMNASGGVMFLDLDRGRELWTKLEPEGGAPSRASAMAVFDAPNGRMIAGFGNTISGSYPDLWELKF